jgi:hypothetical protein
MAYVPPKQPGVSPTGMAQAPIPTPQPAQPTATAAPKTAMPKPRPYPGQAGMNQGMPSMPTQAKAPFLNPTPYKIPGGM